MLRVVADSGKRQILALFLCLFAGVCSAGDDGPGVQCRATADLKRYAVEHVYDGDTLRLRGGDTLRLIGVNTPELGRDGRVSEPLAREALSALETLVAGGLVWLHDGEEKRDRYGRRLGYAFDRDGRSLSGILLRRGLGFHVVVGPNDAYVDCLAALERQAREADLGVWADAHFAPRPVAELDDSEGGFLRLRDRVTHVSFKENGWWVQLGGRVGLRIRPEIQPLFSRPALDGLRGQVIEVRGWLVPVDGDWWIMNVDHPAMMR